MAAVLQQPQDDFGGHGFMSQEQVMHKKGGIEESEEKNVSIESSSTATTATTATTTTTTTSTSTIITNNGESGEDDQRTVGRWYLKETLGKGGYSWVKKGKDKKSGKIVALKFMDRKKAAADSGMGWNKQQMEQVKTEIECLRNLKHSNVMRLMAFNLNCKYPNKGGGHRDVILLVLEYMAGGELFDILYYTQSLDEIVARTYFRQLMNGIEACHNSNIIHRDIKPQNLLLDSKFNLKITDFGLAKYFANGDVKNAVMNTYNVGTRGYQAPEMLQKKDYTGACDIFSCGVVLFVLLAGYPPFEHAKEEDKWYQHIAKSQYRKFWKLHRGCGVQPQAIDLITRMITFDASKRITIDRIKKHPWYNGDILDSSQLEQALRLRHSDMEQKRANDSSKISLTMQSRAVGNEIVLARQKVNVNKMAPALPEEECIGIRDVYSGVRGYEMLSHMEKVVSEKMGGTCYMNHLEFEMEVHIAAQAHSKDAQVPHFCSGSLHFKVNIFYMKNLNINLVKFRRLTGSVNFWKKIYDQFIKLSNDVLTGLPKNLQNMNSEERQFMEKIFATKNRRKQKRREFEKNDSNDSNEENEKKDDKKDNKEDNKDSKDSKDRENDKEKPEMKKDDVSGSTSSHSSISSSNGITPR